MLWFTADLLLPAGVVHAFIVSLLSCLLFFDWWVYLSSHMGKHVLEEAAMVSWGIWQARNAFLWHDKQSTAASTVFATRKFLNHYQLAQKLGDPSVLFFQQKSLSKEHWTPPDLNMIKINVDGALFERWGCFGVGCLARDAHGRLISSHSRRFSGVVQPAMVEIMGIKGP